LFGMIVYISVTRTLTKQVDNTLALTAQQIIENSTTGGMGITLPELDVFTDVFVQVWGNDGKLKSASYNTKIYDAPLDGRVLNSPQPVYTDVFISTNTRLRVLTVPLVIANSNRKVGTLQIAKSMLMVDRVQHILVLVLFLGMLGSMTIAGIASWISTKRAFSPLEAVTKTALNITRADDLSRRIPYSGPPDDEVGKLINAFNKTLSRLENLFNSQKRFVADVGHELRTPLTVIKGNVDLMRRMREFDEESLTSIEDEVDRLTRLVGDLLLLAQAESGKLPLAKQLVELDTLVLEVYSQMHVLAKNRVDMKLSEIDQVLVCGDKDRLKQVLVNLIGNAIKYTPASGKVIISLGKEDDRARITISDNGPGIPEEDIPHIFERFFRSEKSRTRSKEGKGYGLGLSIAYWIVRNHGGVIEVQNMQPHGTTFRVWLPLSDGECN